MNRYKGKQLPIAQAYIEKMAAAEQNPRYHAEGSVLAHTLMVVEKFFELKDRFNLTPSEEEILFWAAVLHDIGKPEVTKYKDGRWTAKGHEKAGLSIARDILLARPEISDLQRRKILDIIRWHGVPLNYSRYQRNEDDLKKLNTRTDLRLLGVFSVFDFHGRICENQEEVLQAIHHFQEVSVPKTEYEMGRHGDLMEKYADWNIRQKNAAWKALKLNKVSLLEALLEAQDKGTAIYSPMQLKPTKVLVTVGPPLSGKTTFLENTYPEAFRINLKDFNLTEDRLGKLPNLDRRMVEFKYYLSLYFRRYDTVIIEGYNINDDLRTRINDAVRELNGEIEYLVFETDLETALSLNEKREDPMDAAALTALYKSFDLVHPWEAHQIRWMAPLRQQRVG